MTTSALNLFFKDNFVEFDSLALVLDRAILHGPPDASADRKDKSALHETKCRCRWESSPTRPTRKNDENDSTAKTTSTNGSCLRQSLPETKCRCRWDSSPTRPKRKNDKSDSTAPPTVPPCVQQHLTITKGTAGSRSCCQSPPRKPQRRQSFTVPNTHPPGEQTPDCISAASFLSQSQQSAMCTPSA